MAATDLNAVRATIETRLKNELGTNAPIVPVVFENVPYTPSAEKSWVYCVTSFGTSQYATLGGVTDSTGKITGVITINIFTPQGQGIGAGLIIGKRIRDLYNRIIVSGVSFDSPIGPESLGFTESEAHFQSQIRVTFDVYEDL
tara:strand:- start:361 stop:789 length:429 start_codon:yes stop_codon:yes gene_type:complete